MTANRDIRRSFCSGSLLRSERRVLPLRWIVDIVGRGEMWTIFTEENVRYALAAECFLHFTDGFTRVHLFSLPGIF